MTSNLPLISIAMATYNGEKFLREQIESIVSQTYKNIEIIICDDNSSDATCEILSEYQKKFAINIIRNHKNLGIVKSFEIALKNCKGEYIILSDQDDIFFREKITILYENIKDSLLIHSDSIIIDENKNVLFNSHFDSFKSKNKSLFIDYLIGNNVTGNSVLINKKLLEFAFPFPKHIRIHDHYLAMCASYYGKISFLPNKLQYYRQHNYNSIGVKKNNYNIFIKNLKLDVKSYIEFLKMKKFNQNSQDIYIHLLLKIGVIRGVCYKKISINTLIKTKGSIKLFCLYFLLNPKYPFPLRNILYSFLSYLK